LDVDVTGKSFMITGANSGIGKCAAVAVAKRGKCLKCFSLETNLYFYYCIYVMEMQYEKRQLYIRRIF
jgi:hypothetical protein